MLDIPFLLSYQIPGLIVTVVFLLFCEYGHKRRGEKITPLHRILILALGSYLMLLFTMTISPEYGFSFSRIGNNVNLIPFTVLREVNLDILNFLGNVILFVPLGFLLVLISRQFRKVYYSLLTGFFISVLIEFLQLFEGRGTDVDDVILNTMGTLLGYLVGYLFVSGKNGLRQSCGASKIINGKKHFRKKISLLFGDC